MVRIKWSARLASEALSCFKIYDFLFRISYRYWWLPKQQKNWATVAFKHIDNAVWFSFWNGTFLTCFGKFQILELEIFCQGSYIQRYPIVAIEDTFYLFGGDSGPSEFTPSNTIAAFSTVTKEWKKLGELNQARYGHGVFIQQGNFIVVGGLEEDFRTERCTLNEEAIRCTLIDPELNGYYYYPEMMFVEPNFCPK